MNIDENLTVDGTTVFNDNITSDVTIEGDLTVNGAAVTFSESTAPTFNNGLTVNRTSTLADVTINGSITQTAGTDNTVTLNSASFFNNDATLPLSLIHI